MSFIKSGSDRNVFAHCILIKSRTVFILNIFLILCLDGKVTHQDFDVLLCKLVEGVALLLEDLDVGRKQVLPLHALASRHRADEKRGVDITEM
jgi:hypothetical protein